MRRSRVLGLLLLLTVLTGLVLAGSRPSTGYQDVTAETCGSEGRCHGPLSEAVTVTIDGPDVILAGETATYSITVNGGPSRRYGYFILLTDPDGRGRDPGGNILFEVEPNSLTKIEDTNHFLVNVTAPRYAVRLDMRVAVNSADGNGNDSGDEWAFALKTVDIQHPVPSEAPFQNLPQGTLPLAAGLLLLAVVGFMAFYVLSLKRIHRGGP